MPDVVIERHTLFSDAGWRVSDAIDVPWALEVNAPPVLERRRFERLRREAFAEDWLNRVLLQAPVVLAVSRWLKTWLETEIGCRNVRWVPNGVTPLRGVREQAAPLGLQEDDRVVGFVGSLKPWHGLESLAPIAQGAEAKLVLGPTTSTSRVPSAPATSTDRPWRMPSRPSMLASLRTLRMLHPGSVRSR